MSSRALKSAWDIARFREIKPLPEAIEPIPVMGASNQVRAWDTEKIDNMYNLKLMR